MTNGSHESVHYGQLNLKGDFTMIRFSPRQLKIPAVALIAMLWVSQASAVPITIDDFDLPNPANPTGLWVINAQDPDPYINQAALVGTIAERDLKIDVIGTPNLISSIGTVGDDGIKTRLAQNAGSTDVVVTTVQYDGVDNPPVEAAGTDLVNSEGLLEDLTAGGNDALSIDWLTAEAGFGTTIQYSVEVHSMGGGSATVTGSQGEDGDDSTIESAILPFASFAGVDFSKVTSLEFRINDIGLSQAIDFQVDAIRAIATVPEPQSISLLALGSILGLVMWRGNHRSRRRG